MARKKIREFDGKRMIAAALKRGMGLDLLLKIAQVSDESGPINKENLLKLYPWFGEVPLVVKPDMLFGKRGKNNLVLLNANVDQAVEFILNKMHFEVCIPAQEC
mmetsp:Transcript_32287/g.126402  ORF Transcript_32287/g.126402 Transcript_32287/m.126402 type:complete len:104 (-) Transcript_32287:4904-5215(-)